MLTKAQREVVEMTIESLTNHPEEWQSESGRYRVRHKSGVSVWIANYSWGVSISPVEGKEIGRVVALAVPWGWRARLYRAAIRATGNHKSNFGPFGEAHVK